MPAITDYSLFQFSILHFQDILPISYSNKTHIYIYSCVVQQTWEGEWRKRKEKEISIKHTLFSNSLLISLSFDNTLIRPTRNNLQILNLSFFEGFCMHRVKGMSKCSFLHFKQVGKVYHTKCMSNQSLLPLAQQ